MGGRHSEAHCLTFLTITKATSSPLLLPGKPSNSLFLSPSPWRQPTGKALPGWEEVRPRERRQQRASRLSFVAGAAASSRNPRPGNSRSVEECGDVPGATPKYNGKARMSLRKHRLGELFSEFISRSCLSFSQPLSRSKGIPQFSCLTNAENLPGQVSPWSDCAPNVPGDVA